MIGRMAKMTVVFPDELVPMLKARAGEGKASEYIARAVRNALLADDLKILAEWEKTGSRDAAWDQLNEEAAERALFARGEE